MENLSTLFLRSMMSFLLLAPLWVMSQTISGTVMDATENAPLEGVTVRLKDYQLGAITDQSGGFKLEVPEGASTLLFSFMGYAPQEVLISDKTQFDILLVANALTLDEVVVTAFGFERDKKALGYSVQEINASELKEARSTNVVNGLSGRVAGVQITSANVIGGGSQVTIRGNGSILGNNQPLYVIDGVPMEGDFAQATGSDATDNNVYGGGISEINPDDIESITVLKGANAAALYGSRAANGVVLVTTKSGKGTEGLGVSYNLNMTMERPFVVPEFQNTYGGGNGYVTWYADGRNGGITDPLAVQQFQDAYGTSASLVGTAGVDESWGAPMDGRLIRHWWSGEALAPLVPVPDSWSNFWESGYTQNHTFALAASNDVASFRFSAGRTDQTGILYNNDYYRNNFRLNTDYKLTDKFSVKVSAGYIKSGSDNRQQPVLWEPQTWHHRHDDWGVLKDYEEYMDVHITREGDEYPYANWQHSFADNRFYSQENLTQSNEKDRFLGNIALSYQFTDALSLMIRSGTDLWSDTRINITRNERTKSFTTRTQSFSEETLKRQESNSDIILTYNKRFGDTFSLNLQGGANHRTNNYKRNYVYVNDVTINGLYNVANNATTNTNRSRIEGKEVNSVFGAASFGYKGYAFLDITGRNDWSSTLPIENNSYFYPSASLSLVLTDMLGIQNSVLSFAKARASWAQVGNDTDPYRLAQVFIPQDPWNSSTPTFSENTVIANSDLLPEKTTGIEFGLDTWFFEGRVGLDLTYYNQTTTNQIINISVSRATGYESKVINAGEIVNNGFESVLTLVPIKQKNFTWDVTLNYARNRNEVVELFTDASGNTLETIVLQSRRGLSLEARVGQPYGTLFGSAYARVEEGEYAGLIIFEDGIPQVADELQIIGNVTPDWIGGIQNTFRFKGFTLSALVDAKIGGDIADESSSTGMQTGIYPITALGREEGVIGVGVKNIGSAESPVYIQNDVVQPTKSVTRMLSVRSVNEGAVYEASYVKLREVSLSYTLPASLIARIGLIKGASISAVGRNLLMLYNTHSQIDPELNIYGGNLQGALYYATLPSTRSLGFNLNLAF
ncbi:MAG: SusC/RagA family TonB-linked outer membrane protein [Bacteroidia bacterium]